ncbi:hypothetical protein CSHISOI_07733 [Colletotrichum shisoi]|uniref:Uncharacterized protein n=1 Tax=Colletotrichum shisoi TaxID=2078593 RepID=A0A5Q4BL79_9PEZI|nr:hypothetical protein CSHISOI_07733 [Colletotrichum shisoi]
MVNVHSVSTTLSSATSPLTAVPSVCSTPVRTFPAHSPHCTTQYASGLGSRDTQIPALYKPGDVSPRAAHDMRRSTRPIFFAAMTPTASQAQASMINMDRRLAREMESSLPWALDFPVVSI